MEYAAVVLSGGAARRLGGTDKASLVLDGTSLVSRALAAVAGAVEVVVVGPVVDGATATFAREEPPGGGPAAAVSAGAAALTSEVGWVVVLAVDMPWVTAATVDRLLRAATPHGAVLTSEGRRHLCAGLPRAQLAGHVAGGRWRDVLPQDVAEVPAIGREAHDVDTWDDLNP